MSKTKAVEMKERKHAVVNPRGVRVVMDVCPQPEQHCIWYMWIDERWLCDCRERVKKLKKCCTCPHNSDWERGKDLVCVPCALSVVEANVPIMVGKEWAELGRLEAETVKKWKQRVGGRLEKLAK
jgi:hypothetical protein